MDQVWTVLLAAGSGSRYGDAPKQYEPLRGRRVLDWSLSAARSVSDGVVLVVATDRLDHPEPEADVVVGGGASRSASVRCGLEAVPESAGVIVVHDAARPLASPVLFASVVAAVRAGAAGAIPGLPVSDTVKRVRGGVVAETLDRSELFAAQTPQAFRAGVLRAAHEAAGAGGLHATDDASLVELVGEAVAVVPGEAANVKITYPEDLP